MILNRRWLRIALVAAPLLLLTGCLNIFSPVDHPSGDPQLISGARAALDRGDFATALDDYQKLSGANADIANSEAAYAALVQSGAGMGAFASAFGSGSNVNAGKAITAIANYIGPNAGAANRLALFQAFQLSAQINDNAQLSGLVRLLTSFALIGELLAEAAATPGHFVASDLVNNPTACAAAGAAPGCFASACGAGGAALTNGSAATPVNLKTATAADITPAASLSLIQSALDQIGPALTDISPSGSFSGSISGFTGAAGLGDAGIAAGNTPTAGDGFNCYRATLLSQGFGTY